MSFLDIALKNLIRRPMRSALTVVGIAIAIAAVVALTSLAWGFGRTWTSAYLARGTDLIVGKKSNQRPLPTPFSESVARGIEQLPEVAAASGTLGDLMSIEDAPALVVFGWPGDSFLWDHLTLREGRWPRTSDTRALALGAVAAELLSKHAGDTLQMEDESFTISAVFTSPAVSENGSVLMVLEDLQRITHQDGLVNMINVRLHPEAGVAALESARQAIQSTFPDLSAFSVGEVGDRNTAVQAAKAMSLATSAVALAVGVVGVTNTVLMSVFERLHDFAVLLAMGWRPRRIVKLVVLESALLSVSGCVAGIAAGLGVLAIVRSTPWVRGKIETDASVELLLTVLASTLVVGVLAGLYPAWVGARISPATGLRHE
jgi:putative ABC transport system permease protein